MKKSYFENIDFTTFWSSSDYAVREYLSDPLTDDMIVSIEQELGYKLPASYIYLMNLHNGGVPIDTCFPTIERTSWAADHVAISGIMGVGRDKSYSLCGELGSPFMIEEWDYPNIGVVICDCPSAGHDVVMLDYRKCGNDGEPEVVHVDQELDYEITYLAKNFEEFIQGLVNDDVYDTSEEDKALDLEKVSQGNFSVLLNDLCAYQTEVDDIEMKIRSICTRIINEKGYFAFHSDELSMVMYDIQFWLYSLKYANPTKERYLEDYPKMIAFGGEFSTGGYGPSFITDWLDDRIKNGVIIEDGEGIRLTEKAVSTLKQNDYIV